MQNHSRSVRWRIPYRCLSPASASCCYRMTVHEVDGKCFLASRENRSKPGSTSNKQPYREQTPRHMRAKLLHLSFLFVPVSQSPWMAICLSVMSIRLSGSWWPGKAQGAKNHLHHTMVGSAATRWRCALERDWHVENTLAPQIKGEGATCGQEQTWT